MKRVEARFGEEAEDERGVVEPDVMARPCIGEVGRCRRVASVREELRVL